MTGPEHYREAARLVEHSKRHTDTGNEADDWIADHAAAQAQVHAQLAHTAAWLTIAMSMGDMPAKAEAAWQEAMR